MKNSIHALVAFALMSRSAYTGIAQPSLQFSASTYTVSESAGSVILTVQRTGDTNPAVTVDYATADGTATNAVKYAAGSGTLVFGPGETNQAISVPILNEGFVEGTKYLRVILNNPTGGAILGARTSGIVNITDNDVGTQFQFTTNSVAEDAGQALLGVVRGDDGDLPVTLTFLTTDISAHNGLDYVGVTNTLVFAPQERLKLISMPILNNTLKQANRTFRVTLANSAGTTFGPQTTCVVTIVDNDQGFRLDSALYSVAENTGVLRISLLRGTDDTNSTVSVDLATVDITATNGVDYIGGTNTFSFAPGEKLKFVSVAILNNGLKQANRVFRVTLSSPTGGAVLGSPTTANVTILNSDGGLGFELGSYAVWENAGSLSVTVLRGNDTTLGPITVDYATSDLTAKAGKDYQAVSGTLAFAQDETVGTINIPILRDGVVENTNSFRVTLSNATGGATLGTAITTVNIADATGLGTYRTVAPPFDTALTIQPEQGFNIITWSGVGQLQKADRPTGPWQMLTNASSPYGVHSALPTTFYRVTRPRPVNLYIPSSYDGQTPMPLVILLHAYTYTGAAQESYMRFQPLAESRSFFYCYPDSAADPLGAEFWNATDACCDFWSTGIDDAVYLRSLIQEIERQFAVDRKRVYLIGHSNGGFMVYRMACQSADLIAGIASLAGVTFLDTNRCTPSEPVNILHIQGTSDSVISYGGGALNAQPLPFPSNMPAFPGALENVQAWAGYNGSSGPVTDASASLDLVLDVAGLDTVVTRYTNCPAGGALELWTVVGGSHVPTLSPQFSPRVIDWLLAHPKP